MRISIVLLLVFLHEASAQYQKRKKHLSAGGEWATELPKRSRQASARSQPSEDAVVSPDGSVRVETVVRTTPQAGSVAVPIREHVAERKTVEPQVLRAVAQSEPAKPDPTMIRSVEPASAAMKEHVPAVPVQKLNAAKQQTQGAVPSDATVLIYDTMASTGEDSSPESEQVSHLLEQVRAIGWKNKLVGLGSLWQGWGSKLTAMLDEIKKLDPKQFVIVSDSHDVLVNTVPGGMKAFLKNFQELTADHPGAVVVGAEGTCCAAAMNLVGGPGRLIEHDGSRPQHSCSSGVGECLHKGAEFDQPWQTFFKELAQKRGFKDASYPYLNAGILSGYAGDVVRVYEFLQAKPQEDDQALLSEAMYRRPDWLVIDYEQRLFGSNSQKGCQYDWQLPTDDNIGHFRNRATGHSPLFIQTSGHFIECYLQKS